jgi:aspartate racemase
MENAIKENLCLIGVIGGVGPYAGLDFIRKILTNTLAVKDQDHLNCLLISCPSIIPDRTGFLLQNEGCEEENPAFGMFESARRLYMAGVRYAAVACNTAHSDRIFAPFCKMVKESLPGLTIINMLETCADYMKKELPEHIRHLGLLATIGTYKSKVYNEYFGADGKFEIIEPEIRGKERIHEAIYSEDYGIKANSQNIKPQARDWISYEIYRLIDRGAEAIILGCTELPLVVQAENYAVPVIDPALITARRLIELTAPEKLLHS